MIEWRYEWSKVIRRIIFGAALFRIVIVVVLVIKGLIWIDMLERR